MSRKSKTILAILVYVLSFGVLMFEMLNDKVSHEDIERSPIAVDDVQRPPEIPNPTTDEELILRRWDRR